MFEIIIGLLPFIINSSILKEELSSLVLFLVGSIFIIKNKTKIKENKYFYVMISMWVLMVVTQSLISPYIESFSASFVYLNMAIYYLIYGYVLEKDKEINIIKYIVRAVALINIFYIIYHGILADIRIYGNIGYANSYGLLLLVTLYLNRIIQKEKFNKEIDIILFLGLLCTGSRTTLLLSGIYILHKIYIDYKYKKIKLILTVEPILIAVALYVLINILKLYSIIIIPLVIMVYYYFIKDFKFKDKLYYSVFALGIITIPFLNIEVIDRIRNISLRSGTLQERFLYYGDAFKEVLANPLGNGISMFQYKIYEKATAFYDVKYMHNSYLQVLYDTGIINGLIFLGLIIWGLLKIRKNKSEYRNTLLLAYLTMIIHSIIDFNFSFPTMTILLVLLIRISEKVVCQRKITNKVVNKNKSNYKFEKENSNISGNKKVITINKGIYIVIATLSIYFIIFESLILLGESFEEINYKLSEKIYTVANNISFNKDFRSYFNKAEAKRLEYNESKKKESALESIELLKISKEINPYNPMIDWNISYMYREIGDSEKAITYLDTVLEKEKFYPGVYRTYYNYLMELYKETKDNRYLSKLEELEKIYYENFKSLNKRAKYMNNQLQDNYDDIIKKR